MTISLSVNDLITAGEVVGLVLASYGLIRESFAELAKPRPYGEGWFGEGAYGGVPSPTTKGLLAVGVRLGLLPRDGSLTLTDHQRNARLAISGTIIAAVSLIADFAIGLFN